MEWDDYHICDEQVQRLVVRGEYHQALEALVRGHQAPIVRYCRATLGNAAHGLSSDEPQACARLRSDRTDRNNRRHACWARLAP